MSEPRARGWYQPVIWTPEMDAALLRLRKRVRAEEAARRLGVSPWTMYRRLRALGAPLRPCKRRPRA